MPVLETPLPLLPTQQQKTPPIQLPPPTPQMPPHPLFALQRHERCAEGTEAFTQWLEHNGLLLQGLGPGVALEVTALEPLQGNLCRHLSQRTLALVAAIDEDPSPLTRSVVTGGCSAKQVASETCDTKVAHATLRSVISDWGARHPELPLMLSAGLLSPPANGRTIPPALLLPQGALIVYGTRRRGLLYQACSPGWSPQGAHQRRISVRSIGKSFACAAALRLQQQGRMHLDDPISKYLPAWNRPDKAQITLSQILNHVSGIQPVPDDHPAGACPDLTLEGAAAMLADLPVLARPGERFAYVGVNLQILGALVERVTSKSWNEAFRELVAEPLGMADTSFLDLSATGPNPTNPAIGPGAVSTPADVLRYTLMVAHGGATVGLDTLDCSSGTTAHSNGAAAAQQAAPFLTRECFEMMIADFSTGADPSGCPIGRRLVRADRGAWPYINGLRDAGVISEALASAARDQADGLSYAMGGWPNNHAVTGARNFMTLGYLNGIVHVARAESDDPAFFVLLTQGRYSPFWQVLFAAIEAAVQGDAPLL